MFTINSYYCKPPSISNHKLSLRMRQQRSGHGWKTTFQKRQECHGLSDDQLLAAVPHMQRYNTWRYFKSHFMITGHVWFKLSMYVAGHMRKRTRCMAPARFACVLGCSIHDETSVSRAFWNRMCAVHFAVWFWWRISTPMLQWLAQSIWQWHLVDLTGWNGLRTMSHTTILVRTVLCISLVKPLLSRVGVEWFARWELFDAHLNAQSSSRQLPTCCDLCLS